MTEIREQTISENNLNETMDETEDGEILEDGEIADEDDTITSIGDHKTIEQKSSNTDNEKENNNKDKDLRDSRKREDRKSEDRNRDKDKDRRSDRERDRDRRDRYDRNDRSDRSERDRKSSSTDRDRRDSDRDRKTSNSEDERRRKERDRKRRRSDEDDRDDRQKDTDKRKRVRDQNWNEFNNNNDSNRTFDDFERRPFEDFDFRLPQNQSFPNSVPMHERDLNDDEEFDEREFEEVFQLNGSDKRAMMKAMALMMKRNLNSEKLRQTRDERLRDKRRPGPDRQPGPTGTRTGSNRTTERQTPFKQICKYFLDGKCHKGVDCPFSHDAMPLKKKELCKFYLQGFCGKGEECLFMHSEFPCKFFHTNVECYSGDNCRFSHSPLTEETREILRNYLDSGTLPDDPKPDRQNRHSDIDKNVNNESHIQNNCNTNESQTNSDSNSNSVLNNTFTPIKPVVKRHALLGDPTQDMKNSHLTWIWQQEMKELEDAYVGNKRNLFCIEKPFVMSEKPSTPRMEDDEDEIEEQIRNYYKDTMPDFEADTDERQNVPNPSIIEEQKLIEASAHDEDLRTLVIRPRTHTNESLNSQTNSDLIDDKSQSLVIKEESQSQEVPQSMPKAGIDLYLKMQNKLQNDIEVKTDQIQSDSDEEDDKNVLAAAMKNVQQSSNQSSTDKISQMLSIIRNTSNTTANQSPQQSEFWQNIMSGIHLANVSTNVSPTTGNTPPRNDFRDPRLKRGKESLSPSVDKTPPVKICDPNVKIEYKLVPIKANDIDYSTYVSIYRIDARLKNDPRLNKFFSKLPSSEIDNLSRIVPPPLKTAPVTPLCVLKSMQKAEQERQRDMRDRTESPTLPPLPPLTISPTKSVPTPGICPPTPPPIMSPLELISSSKLSSNNL